MTNKLRLARGFAAVLLILGVFNSVPVLAQDTALDINRVYSCLLYTSPSPRDLSTSRMPSSA